MMQALARASGASASAWTRASLKSSAQFHVLSARQNFPRRVQQVNPLTLHRTPKRLATQNVTANIENVAANKPIAWWLLGCGAMVAGMVAVGGITRATRSGLSMVDWKPHGGLPPMNHEEWMVEFERYKQFPEFQQRKNMDLNEFKQIFFWEYGHRMLGRTVGLVYGLPMAYFLIRKRVPQELKKRLGVLFSLGAAQGAIGWWMVKSGLEEQDDKFKEVRVSPYRLATHLTMAVTTYGLLLWTAFDVLQPPSTKKLFKDMMDPTALAKAHRVRRVAGISSQLLGFTIISGAFVAGTDAGMSYNTFPKMGDQWIPDEVFEMEPFYRNFFENVALVQLDHRVLAMSTLTGVSTMFALARQPHVWNQLPAISRTALNTTLGVTGLQVTLGITTLLHACPLHIAITHQAGSLAVLTSLLWSMHTLRFAKAVPKSAINAAVKQVKAAV